MVFDHLTDPELKLIAANQLVLDAEMMACKVSSWADGLRREIDRTDAATGRENH